LEDEELRTTMVEAVAENGLSGQEEFDKYITDINANNKAIGT